MSLYIVATPIGNLSDITFRAIDILKNVDFIATEDPTASLKLLKKYDIKKPLIKYNEGNKENAVPILIEKLLNGKAVAYISEAGTPTISDPGYLLVKEAIKHNIKVIPIPGAVAFITAFMASGMATDEILFLGFAPKKETEIKKMVEKIKFHNITTAFYVSPHNLKKVMEIFEKELPNRKITIGRELTKKFEQFFYGTVTSIKPDLLANIKGEYCIIIEKDDKKHDLSEQKIVEKANKLLPTYSLKEIAKILSISLDINKNKIYNILIKNLKK